MKTIILSKGTEELGVGERRAHAHIHTQGGCMFSEEARLKNRGPNKGE